MKKAGNRKFNVPICKFADVLMNWHIGILSH
jgi:hypothetical protein